MQLLSPDITRDRMESIEKEQHTYVRHIAEKAMLET